MTHTFSKLRDLLDGRERRNAVLLFGLMLLRGIIEAAGVASIMPLMAVLANPGLIHANQRLAAAYAALGFSSAAAFLTFLTALAFALIVFRIAVTALSQYAIARYSQLRSYTLSTRLLEHYLRRPYSWFLDRHSADLGKAVLSEVDQVISGSLMPALEFLSQAVVTIFLLGLIVVLQPVVALTAALLLGGFYVITYWSLQRYMGRLGQDRLRANKLRFQLAQEVLTGIKEVKIGGLESVYLHRYRGAAHCFASRRATHMVLREMPHHVLEAVAFGGALAVVLVMMTSGENSLLDALPVLALFALAATRLLPALHKLYQCSVMFRFGKAALDELHADIVEIPHSAVTADSENRQSLALRHHIELADVTFTYSKASVPTLANVSLAIRAKTTVGFVGRTGAGKTTVVDIILGLLEAQGGEVRVDGQRINAKNVRSWQRSIGYVPQHIFLADDTVAGNIAFGVAPSKIDMRAVERAARIAELHDFVTGQLPKGYQTTVGERGVRLSGGQRQRIGIARALYHDPDVLVMDEATSSLDSLTEKALMDAIQNLAHRKTILLVAHRLGTVRACDQVFLFDHGRLKAAGTYDELLSLDAGFQKMVTSLAA